jgi:hypothetical protein
LIVTKQTIFDDLAKIRNPDYQPPKQWGVSRRCHLTFDEEKLFLEEYLEKVKSDNNITTQKLHFADNEIV